jgi:UDP-glucose 4-epimerase
VADQLSLAGHKVQIFDRSKSKWLRQGQIMKVGDLLDLRSVYEAVTGCDIVYNFAAVADLNEALNKPIDTVKINVLGNTNILEACRELKVKRFLYASTVYVYSREGGFYRCSKQAAESYVEEYQKSHGLNYTILRYGSLYGLRSDYSNGLYRIIKDALERGVISYQGSPDTMREYIHVEDAARASVAALGEKYINRSVVITGQESMRVLDLLAMLAEILGYNNPIEFIKTEHPAHYIRTPYAYQPKLGLKYSPSLHVDLGQGLLELIGEVQADIDRGSNVRLTP